MPTIDESVVKLSLDDSQFDKASDRTIKKLDELKASLNFNGSVDGFKEIEKAVKKTDFSPMEKGVQAVSTQFNALYTIADQFVRLKVNQVINSIEGTIKSLTIDNVAAGWDKYAEKTSAVQTIMASTADQFEDTGIQMEYVEGQLDKLNWFTDETSYKFLDMANNIGKFTANEVGLNDSVTAMQGISNWAAISGAGIRGASMAMYNLAQAISMGSLKLQDWRSIELANMGTSEFKRVAMEAGETAGTLIKLADGVYKTVEKGTEVTTKSFRNSLSEGWLTTEVLMDTLKRYGDFTNELYKFAEITDLSATPLIRYINEYKNGTLDLEDAMISTGMSSEELIDWLERLGSEEYDLGRRAFAAAQEAKTFQEAVDAVKEAVGTGWMQTFENIFGNYEEAKQLWSDLAEGLYEVFVESGNMRNGILRDWKEIGGRTYLIEGIYDLFGKLRDAIFFFTDTIREVFPRKTAEELKSMSQGFKELIELLTPSEAVVNAFHNSLTLLLTIMKKVGQVAIVIFAGLEPIWSLLVQIGSAIMGLIGDISALIGLNLNSIFSADALTTLYKILYTISSLIAALARGALIEVVSILGNILSFGEDIWRTFKAGEGGIKGFINAILVNFSNLFNRISGGNGLPGIINNIIFSIKSLYESIKSGNSVFSLLFNGIANLAKIVLAPIGLLVKSIFGDIDEEALASSPFVNFFIGISKAISDSNLIENIGLAGSAILQFISDAIGGVNGIRDAGKELNAVISFLMDQFGVLWDWFVEELTKLSFRDVADVMILLFIAQLIQGFVQLTAAAKGAVSGFSGILTSVRQVIDTFSGNGLNSMSKSINDFLAKTKYLQMAVAIGVLVDGLIKLSEVDTGKLGVAVGSIALVIGMLSGLMALMKKFSSDAPTPPSGDNNNGTVINFPGLQSMLQFAIGIRLLVGAVSTIADIVKTNENGAGGYADLIAGLVGLGLVMAEIGAFVYLVDKLNLNADLTKTASSLTLFALALTAMMVPITLFSFFNWEDWIQGIGGVAVMMISFAGAAKLMESVDAKSILAAATSLSIMAIGMTALSVPIMALSLLDLGSLAQGGIAVIAMLAALTGVCVVISKWGSSNAKGMLAAGAAMISFSAAVIVLSGAMLIMQTISWEGIAKGVSVIIVAFLGFAGLAVVCQNASLGLLALAGVIISVGASFALFSVGVKTLVEAVAEFIVIAGVILAVAEGLGDDFPAIVSKAFENVEIVFHNFLMMIPNLAADISAAAFSIIIAIKYGFLKAAPDLVNGLLVILLLILDTLGKWAAPIMASLANLIDSMASQMPVLWEAVGRFVEEFFAGVGEIVYGALIGLFRGVLTIFGQKDLADEFGAQARGVGNYVGEGFEKGLRDKKDDIDTASSDLMKSALSTMQETGGIESPSWITEMFGNYLGEGLVNGIDDFIPSVENSGFNTMASYFSGMTTGIKEGGSNVESMMDALLRMVGIKADAVNEAVAFSYEIGNPEYAGLKPQERLAMAKEAARSGNKAGTVMGESFNDALNTSMSDVIGNTKTSAGKSSGSASTKVQTEAEKIIESYKSALDELEYLDKKYKGEFDLFQALNPNLTELQKNTNELELINKEIETQTKRTQIAQEKYEKIAKAMGKTSQEARDAEIEWIENQTKLAELQNRSIETQNSIIESAAKQLELEQKNAESSYNLWVASNKNASEVEKQQKELEYTMAKLEYSAGQVTKATEKYNEAVSKYGENSNEALEALNELLQTQTEYAENEEKLLEVQKSGVEIAKELAELNSTNATLEYQIWEQANRGASAAEKKAKETEDVMNRYEHKMHLLSEATEEYNKACEKFGKDSIEAARAYEKMLEYRKNSMDIYQEVVDSQTNYLNMLADELSSSLTKAELEDQLWESVNENATDVEKHERNIYSTIRRQVYAQQELLILEEKYNNLLEAEGENSEKTKEAYANILSKKIEIVEYDNQLKDYDMESVKLAMESLEFEEKRLDIAKSIWDAENENASESLKTAREIEDINAKMVLSMQELNNLADQYNMQIERYGETSNEARDAWEAYKNKQLEIIKLQNERKSLELEIIENEISMVSLAESRSKTEYDIWKALNEDLDDSTKRTKEISYQMKTLEFQTDKLRLASKKYNYALKMYGEDAKETQELFNSMLDAQLSYVNTYNELKTAQADILEKNNQILEQLAYSEKLLDYGYNMWDKLNSDLDDAQKMEAQIKKLNQDITKQVARANYYGSEWRKAVAQYGSNSSEAQEAYLNYLDALYNALDIQESIAEKEQQLTEWRAENAQKLQDAWDEVKATDLVGGTSIYEELLEMGLSEEEIEAYVKEKAGYIEEAIGTEMDFSIDTMQKKAEDALKEWGLTWVDGTVDVASRVVETSSSCMDDMTAIIEEGAAEGEEAAQKAMEEIEEIVEDGADATVIATENGIDQLVNAIRDGTVDATQAMRYLTSNVLQAGTVEAKNAYYNIGGYMTYGIAEGIYQNKNSVINAMKDVINQAVEAAKKAAKIKSPSRVTMWVGEMLDAGFIRGIENDAGVIARTMASTVQNGINSMRDIVHTSNAFDFVSSLISNGITGAFGDFTYDILSISNEVLESLSKEYDGMVEDAIGENKALLDALREYGFDETTHGIEFVVNLDATDARTELEELFAAREEQIDYYEDLLDMREKNAEKDQSDLGVLAEGRAISKELDRVLASINSYEDAISRMVDAGKSSDYENSIAGKKTEFIQNIYSTKPLSPLDVYRNTNSLLLKFNSRR